MNPLKTTLLYAALAATLLTPRALLATASQWAANPQASVRLISPWRVAPRSGELFLGLHFRLAPGWHVYWKNSGDAGFPPAVTLQPAAALGKPQLLWPTPRRFDLPGGLVAFGYEGEVVYPVRVILEPDAVPPAAPAEQVPSGEPPGGASFPITADLDYLVCEVDCIPYRAKLTLEQPVGDQPLADSETAPLLQAWLDRLPRPADRLPGVSVGTLLDASRPRQPELEIRLRGVEAQPGKTDLFLESHELLDAGRPRMTVLPGGVIFRVPLKPREANKPLPGKVAFAWTVSNLSKDGKSLGLEARRETEVWTQPAGTPGGKGKTPAAGLGRLLLWALLGGALLNLSPAVLALFAGEALALRQAGPGVRERAAAAATGIIGACWGLAALALAARRLGLPVGWGADLQEPALGALLAVASVVLALNLWGLVEIPLATAGGTGTGRHLLAGLFTVPLALAWPMPLLREPLRYAFGRGPATVCAVYIAVGFGLALPYLILSLVPAAVRLAPGTASWLPRLREALGFVAGASAFWTLHALSRQVSPEGLAWIELSLLGMALFAWLRARERSGRALCWTLALGLAVCAAGALWLADRNRLAPRPGVAGDPLHPSSRGLTATAREPISNRTSGG